MPIVVQSPFGAAREYIAVPKELRVVFFGTPAFAVPSLERLHADGWPIAAVVTAPDKPVGRKREIIPSPVKQQASDLGIEVFDPKTLKSEEFFSRFDAIAPNVAVVVAYGKIIPQRYLTIPRLGFLNLHPSLLPALRGPTPIETAILHGESHTGISIMLLDEEMDHGPILSQRPYDIPWTAYAPKVRQDLAELGATVLGETLASYAEGTKVPYAQDHALATTTRKFTRLDGRLDWHADAVALFNRIRALSAEPGTWTTWEGKTLNIHKASVKTNIMPLSDQSGFVIATDDGPAVFCGSNVLVLDEIQLEGSTRMTGRQFINGRRTFVGSTLV